MSAFSRGLLALAYEIGGLVLVYSLQHHAAVLLIYFAVHGVASGLAALTLLPLLPGPKITRPLAAFVFFFALNFFLPVLGVMGMLGAAVMAKVAAVQGRRWQFDMHLPPVYDPREEEVADAGSKGGVRVQLANTAVPIEARLRALLMVQSMPARIANPLIREMLSDPAEDLRLIAYGILDTREKTINARIHATSQKLERTSAAERPLLEKQLAELYWELIYQGLVQGDLREHAAQQARVHLERAVAGDPDDAALRALAGQIAMSNGRYDEAQRAFEQALELGLPDNRVLPYMAEVAFRRRRFDEVRALAGRLASLPSTHRIDHVVHYWQGDRRALRKAA
jgi:tetratricopeptide (TPR) repeat protein